METKWFAYRHDLVQWFSNYGTRTPWGYGAGQEKITESLYSRTGNFIYILAIVYLVLVTEKWYLKCFVGKKGYSV